jgi:hypothetical protein
MRTSHCQAQADFTFLRFLGDESLMPNWWLLLLGARLGQDVKCCVSNIADPCGADLVQIGDRSVLSQVVIKTEVSAGVHAKELGAVCIGHDCNIGLESVVGPCVVMDDYAFVGALTHVRDAELKCRTLYFGDLVMGVPDAGMLEFSNNKPCMRYVVVGSFRLVVCALFAIALVPPFDVAQWLLYGDSADEDQTHQRAKDAPMDRSLALLLMLGPVLVTFLCWTMVAWFIAEVVFGPAVLNKGPRFAQFYVSYQVAMLLPQSQLLPLCYGSVSAVLHLQLFGGQIHSSAYINSYKLCDHFLLTVEANCVIDMAFVLGHKAEGARLIFGPNSLREACNLQPLSITWAGDDTPRGTTLGARSKNLTGDVELSRADLANDDSFVWRGVPARKITNP